ncbi:MAG: ATP-binding cassette domain-containing protein [Promicromonosporaceae bacterium]|nr:ATP-binding cassette domain-containing protein [Promicromonosporaceae bacterium]
MTAPLLTVKDLVVEYPIKGFRAKPFRALKGVSLDIRPGECVGLVGESGSGKTTLGRAVLGLAPVTEGSITLHGEEIGNISARRRREIGKDVQVVFQDPYTSLNPAMTIEAILSEPLLARRVPRVDEEGLFEQPPSAQKMPEMDEETLVEPPPTRKMSKAEARERVANLLEEVRLPADAMHRLPREFSGGQRQRIAIARALALDPELIICDEPVSALDLSTQARVLDLFKEIQDRTKVAYLFITHDLDVVRHISHRVAVMWKGEIVEAGDTAEVTCRPEHPYTQRLWMAAPVADPVKQKIRREDRRQLLAAQAIAEEEAAREATVAGAPALATAAG